MILVDTAMYVGPTDAFYVNSMGQTVESVTQCLAVVGELQIDAARVNVKGGAIALGHLIGRIGRLHHGHPGA